MPVNTVSRGGVRHLHIGLLITGILLFGVGSFLIFCKIQSLGAAALDGKKMMVFMEDVGWVMNTEVNCKADALLKSL